MLAMQPVQRLAGVSVTSSLRLLSGRNDLLTWLLPILPLIILVFAGHLLGWGLTRNGVDRYCAISAAVVLFAVIIFGGPFVMGAGGVFGNLAEALSFGMVVLGTGIAASLVALSDPSYQRLSALLLCIPLLFWATTIVRDTVPQDQATRCAVTAMADALHQLHAERGIYPATIDEPDVQAQYALHYDTLAREGCFQRRLPAWLAAANSVDYTAHLEAGGWNYTSSGNFYQLGLTYSPRKLGWLMKRTCRYDQMRMGVPCGIAW